MNEATLNGSLAAFKLPEVLTFISMTRNTGTLTLSNGTREAYVFFNDGSLIYAGSNQEQFRLGAILLRKRRITREQAETIEQLMRKDGGRYGQIAVKQGVLTDAQLRDFLKVQVSEIIYDCFVWSGGSFRFNGEMPLPQHAVTISIDLANLIMEGARRIEEWEQCLRLLPDKSAIFRVVSNPSEEKITLTADEWKILFLINGTRTLEELCHDAGDDPFHVYRVVYGLFASKLIETVAPLDDSASGPTRPVTAHSEDTFIQPPAQFGADSTMRERDDDTSLLVSQDAKLSYSDVVKPTIAQLTFATDGHIAPLSEQEYLAGRHRDNQIVIADLGVSGFHARIFRGPDGYIIEDLKSRNGVWLNGTRVYQAVLKQGDVLRLGATDLIYEILFSA
jgi:pSer/pThr/pTyr-binding forkhead associated (FHA) protein